MSGIVEVAVAGAGPAGVAAALEAARRGHEVALVDRARFPRDKPCGEGLLPSALAALEALGLLGRVRPLGQPLDGIAFSVAGGPTARARFCDAEGAPARGLGVRRRDLDQALVAAARETPGVTVLEGVGVLGPLVEDQRVAGLRTSAGTIRARVVIAADGLRSMLRARLGAELRTPRARRTGLRVHLRVPALPFGRFVHVVVAEGLEYYVTPVAPDELQVAVLGDRRHFARAGIAAATLVDHLRLGSPLAEALDGARTLDRPLGAGPFRQRVRAVVLDGALLSGDAAGYVDAITGEGVGLALRSGAAAGRVAAEALGRTPGTAPLSAQALRDYDRAHAAIVRDAERLTHLVLACASRPWLARRAVAALAWSPDLFQSLLRVQAGAPLSTVPVRGWARLFAGPPRLRAGH